jgi:hypothetical protein
MATQSTVEKVSALPPKKKFRVFPHVFRNPLSPIPNPRPSSSDAREPISVSVLLNLKRKRRIMIKDVNVSNVRERWTRW